MKKYFCLSIFACLMAVCFISCSEDDNTISITGNWIQKNAHMGSEEAYAFLHFDGNGKGHLIFRSKSNQVTYYEIFYGQTEDDFVVISGSSIDGAYKVQRDGRHLYLTKEGLTYEFEEAAKMTKKLLRDYYWEKRESLTYVLRWEFQSESTGVQKVKNGKQTIENKFNYTLDESTCQLKIVFEDGSELNFFYTAFVYGAMVFFSSGNANVQYIVYSPSFS